MPLLLPLNSQYAICGLVRLAVMQRGAFCLLEDLVEGTTAPEHAVRKVFNQLNKHKLVKSVRGSRGGVRIGRDAHLISLMEVIEAVDGPWPATPWGENHLWSMGETCPLAQSLQPLWDLYTGYLRSTRISDLIKLVKDPAAVCRPLFSLNEVLSNTSKPMPVSVPAGHI